MVLLMRSSGDPLQWVQPVKDVVRALDPNLPMLQTRSYEDLYRYNAVDGPGAATKLIGTMGAVGLLMAIAGLYGLVAYNVSRRTREIGIRMALGAGPSDVLRLVMGKGLVLVGIGTAIGLAMGFGVERLLKATLFNTGGVDMVVYVVVVPSMVAGDDAGGVTARAKSLPHRAHTGAAIRVVAHIQDGLIAEGIEHKERSHYGTDGKCVATPQGQDYRRDISAGHGDRDIRPGLRQRQAGS